MPTITQHGEAFCEVEWYTLFRFLLRQCYESNVEKANSLGEATEAWSGMPTLTLDIYCSQLCMVILFCQLSAPGMRGMSGHHHVRLERWHFMVLWWLALFQRA